ncbi:MAG: hypothetical protein EPN25_14565 [Nitrospirae bacterium]|nr:MAG: hypothetical protein EPN25_14565 [Nitrospirota bacterium]
MKRIWVLAATGIFLLGLAGSGLHAAESLNKVPAVNKPPATRAADLKRPAPTTLLCPDTITVMDITTKTSEMPGFTGTTVGNVPTTFVYESTGRASATQCFCQYKNGDIRASIHADMLGYHSCNVSVVPKPGGGTATGILLYR